ARLVPPEPADPRGPVAAGPQGAGPTGPGGAGAMGAVFSRWEEIAGPALARHARPVRLAGDVLVVAVDEPAWATQVRSLGTELLRRVGEVAGRRPDRLRVTVRAPGGPPGEPPGRRPGGGPVE
ncbi:MAG: DciA family protein, partial [Acidimicrobiales bacterium]